MNSVKNRGIKMTEADVQALIDLKKERLAKQQERRDKLDQTIENTSNDIEQLEYTVLQMKRSRMRSRRMISSKNISEFFIRVNRAFERLQRRLHHTLNYVWFCLVLCARYTFESRNRRPASHCLSPNTVLGYFKREREML